MMLTNPQPLESANGSHERTEEPHIGSRLRIVTAGIANAERAITGGNVSNPELARSILHLTTSPETRVPAQQSIPSTSANEQASTKNILEADETATNPILQQAFVDGIARSTREISDDIQKVS